MHTCSYQVHRVNVNSSDHQTLLQTLFQLLEVDFVMHFIIFFTPWPSTKLWLWLMFETAFLRNFLVFNLHCLLKADVWKEPTQFLSHFDVMIPGKSLTMFKDALRDLNLSHSLRIRDVQVLIDDEHVTHGKRHPRRTRRFRFNQYNDYSTVGCFRPIA